jgi:glycosyltransferase involved in cell wall biosynthesis
VTTVPEARDPLVQERFAMLSIFFPMWNEEAYIHRAIRAAKEVCEHLVADGEIGDYELIVVDDASTDATGRLADALAAVDAHVRVVHHTHNRKLGGSIKSGLAAARGDLVLYTDADLPFEMIELVRAVRVIRNYEADVVSAYRLDRTGEGPRRAIYSWTYNGLIHTMFGVRLRDINFAFKLCRRRVLDSITLLSEGSFIDAELIIRAKRSGFEIVQIGVDYFPRSRGVSTLSSFGVIRTMLREMTALRKDLKLVTPVTARETGGVGRVGTRDGVGDHGSSVERTTHVVAAESPNLAVLGDSVVSVDSMPSRQFVSSLTGSASAERAQIPDRP